MEVKAQQRTIEQQRLADEFPARSARERDLDRLVVAAVNLPWLETFDEPDRLVEALAQL